VSRKKTLLSAADIYQNSEARYSVFDWLQPMASEMINALTGIGSFVFFPDHIDVSVSVIIKISGKPQPFFLRSQEPI
jgi:hypothetical protein